MARMTQTDDVLALLHRVMGVSVLGVYLHGSVVLGRLRPRSDLDLLAVTARSLRADERRALLDGLLGISGWARVRPGDRPVELGVAVAADLVPWRHPPVVDFEYGEWLRGDYEAGVVPGRRPSPDLAILVAQAAAADRAVAGVPARDLLPVVPMADIRAAALDGIPALLDDLEPDTANVVLTFARIWTTIATGRIRAKDEAADWALPRLAPEHRPVLERARDVYIGTAEDRWEDLAARVRPHVDVVLASIATAAAEAGAG
jgi:streptomycin 3"-adenylyltransferase